MPSTMPSVTPRLLLLTFALLSAHAVVTHAAITKIYPEGTTPCPEVPSLECKHDSQCVEGEAEMDPKHSHLNLKTSLHGYHCDCPDGFLGHDCDIRVEDCDDDVNVLSCYHGSECRYSSYTSRSEQSMKHLMGYSANSASCDCEALNEETSDISSKFAGFMCEHKSTAYCALSAFGKMHAPRKQFCANHGTCKEIVTSEGSHPGCRCTEGWTGNHCEIILLETMNDEEAQASGRSLLFPILMVIIAGVMAGMTANAFKTRRQALTLENLRAAEEREVEVDLEDRADGTDEDTVATDQDEEGFTEARLL